MYPKTEQVKRPYSRQEVEKLAAIGKEIEEMRKKPGFKKAIKKFIQLTT